MSRRSPVVIVLDDEDLDQHVGGERLPAPKSSGDVLGCRFSAPFAPLTNRMRDAVSHQVASVYCAERLRPYRRGIIQV